MERKFLFLYLNTGGGHIAPAKVLKEAMQEKYPDMPVILAHGFSESDIFGKFFFEKGYGLFLNYFKGAFPLTYDLAQYHWIQNIFRFFLSIHTPIYIRNIIKREHITDVVSFHFAVTSTIKKIMRGIPWRVRFTEIATDPFNGPHAWFHWPDEHFMVMSQQMKDSAIAECSVSPDNIKVIPFLINKKFLTSPTNDEKIAFRLKHGFDPSKKIVLLVGGGEGLPGALEIVQQCIFHKAQFTVAVVCGRDSVKKKVMDTLRLTTKLDLHVFGYVDFMDELIKLCDCAVIKAGASTIMEVLVNRKPVIICHYIHNQELGNVRFAVNHKVGWFIQKPHDIYKKVNELLSDDNFASEMEKNFDSMQIDANAGKVVDLLMEDKWVSYPR
ncbi:MAG: hypothetical protein K6E51_08730 [Treponema sp.]|nr:hypothetical protein [Treponema sp.]